MTKPVNSMTHMLQVRSDHGTWVDDLGLWGCPSAAAAIRQARRIKRLPGRQIYADRAYRVLHLGSGDSTRVELS